MRPYANLHLHSLHSDGKFTPEELVLLAKEEGYGAIAVTDHDAVTANEEMAYYAKKHGLESIFGCEFTASERDDDGVQFHFVAFDFDPTYPPMAKYLRDMAERQTDKTVVTLERCHKAGFMQELSMDDVYKENPGVQWFCNEQVFRTMVKKGLAKPEDYEDWANDIWYYHEHQGEIPPLHPYITSKEIIDLVHAAGGIVLLAHPHHQLHFIDGMIELGVDGIEVYHPDLTPEEQLEAMRIAYEKNLFIAGGTDHSGTLGGEYVSFEDPTQCYYYIEPHAFGAMKEHFDELKSRKIGARTERYTYTSLAHCHVLGKRI